MKIYYRFLNEDDWNTATSWNEVASIIAEDQVTFVEAFINNNNHLNKRMEGNYLKLKRNGNYIDYVFCGDTVYKEKACNFNKEYIKEIEYYETCFFHN